MAEIHADHVRRRTEEIERITLSPYACLSKQSEGRKRKEQFCDVRTCFQRDRDRILHCNAFLRLKHKTQVFLSPRRDHYRTRLVHSLEVAQVARTVARGLRLNEDLTEAIALGHDLGHAPFGHAGETALNEVCPYGFTHAQNSVRVVTFLEKNGKGLNLSCEVIDGIRWHSNGSQWASTQEGKLVKICDKVAYVNHDIEDAEHAGLLDSSNLPVNAVIVLGKTKSQRISTIVHSLIENSKQEICMEESVQQAQNELRNYMFEHVYAGTVAQQEQEKAREIIRILYRYYLDHIYLLPAFYQEIANTQDKDRAVCDYISGMSDNYIIEQYTSLFVPTPWSI